MTVLTVNGVNQVVDAPGDTRLLWVIREHLGLLEQIWLWFSLCGACTVHLNGEAVRSCQVEISDAEGAKITTIEGLNGGQGGHPVQQAWLELQVPQCGYCQSGQMMNAAAFLASNPSPTDNEIIEAQQGNICRCITYNRIGLLLKERLK